MKWIGKGRCQPLTTPFEASHGPTWADTHPRPQLYRKSWQSLCGDWSLSVKDDRREIHLGTVQVPFPPESRLSGIGQTLKQGQRWIYRRTFQLENPLFGRLLLHFGAADQIARVTLNGRRVGGHTGGYLPFSLDITELVEVGENRLTVSVTDELNPNIPYGKQRRDRGGMWYTPVSGLWQPVWLEWVPEQYIRSLRITSTLDTVTIESVGGAPSKRLAIQTPNGTRELRYTGDKISVRVKDPHPWAPEDPVLYPFVLTDGEDTVSSYFALRTVTIEKRSGQAVICLNGKPTLLHGLLDQGYFSDGIYLPARPEGYLFDIQTAKALGFNALRKHIKVEPELFYYYCDKLGMVVLQDMVNSGPYYYLRDTALPNVLPATRKNFTHQANPQRSQQFEQDCQATVDWLYNHPCVCYYTIFNEGWGQYDADRLYQAFKALDPSRVWDATSGWFAQQDSDVTSEHVYFKPVSLTPRPDRPLVLSEFGGYACPMAGHTFKRSKAYGYRHFKHTDGFSSALEALYRQEILPAISNGLCAAILTQLSDVEDEVNGLVTYDRQVVKCDKRAMQALSRDLHAAFRAKFGA